MAGRKAEPTLTVPSGKPASSERCRASGGGRHLRVMHVITRLIIGGAQENTLLNVEDLMRIYGDEVLLVTGPAEGPEGDLFDRVKRSGVPVHVVPELIRAVHPVRDVIAYRKLLHLMQSWQPDVVHTHSSKAGILGRAAATRAGVPVVVHTVHGSPFHPYERPWKNWLYRTAERWAAHRCHGLIAVSQAMKQLYVESGIVEASRVQVIYSGMEADRFLVPCEQPARTRARLGIAQEAVVIGKVARLFELKGHEYVIQAAEQVIRANPRVCFLFVGDGVLRDALAREIQRRGLGDHFVFTGLVRPQEVPDLIHAMDIVVHCSLREGLARVLAQAKLAAKPVVAFRLDGAWEVIEDGESGFLVEPENVTELAERLAQLASDPSLRRRMGAAGRDRLVERFDHRTMTAQIRRLYVGLLEQNGGDGHLA